jgi:hypothetical protein
VGRYYEKTMVGEKIEAQCIDCPIGYLGFGTTFCTGCGSGFYQSEEGQAYCMPCIPCVIFLFLVSISTFFPPPFFLIPLTPLPLTPSPPSPPPPPPLWSRFIS